MSNIFKTILFKIHVNNIHIDKHKDIINTSTIDIILIRIKEAEEEIDLKPA